ncbi:MAG TPA: recombinase family protein [Streptosporangiaceae bacterium]|nr:recombinase family protein [Streptosporangiaceae bacterium]
MTDGIGYYRQSKSDPDGIERQREKVRKMFADAGINLLAEYEDDDVSASKSKRRRGYEAAMAHVQRLAPGDVLGLSKTARLYRKVIELENIIPVIEQTGIIVRSAEASLDLATPNGRMVARMLVAAAQAEVEEKADRQKSANLQDAKQGRRNKTGIRPFGWADDKVTHVPAEADAIRDGADAVLAGASLSSVVRDWTNRGLRPPFSNPKDVDGEIIPRTRTVDGQEIPYSGKWSQTTVRGILLNPQNAGLRVYQGEVIGDGNWTAIISVEKWQAVKAILSNPSRIMPRGAVTLLGGLAVCTCGNRMKHGTRTNKHRQAGVPYGIYRCDTSNPDRGSGPHACVQSAIIDTYVQDVLLETLSREPELFAREIHDHDIPKLRKESKSASDGLAQLAGDAAIGIIPRSVYLQAAERISARIAEISEMVAEAGRQDALALLLSAEDIEAEWNGFDISIKRAVLSSVCSRIILRSPGCGCRNPDMSKVVTFKWRVTGNQD